MWHEEKPSQPLHLQPACFRLLCPSCKIVVALSLQDQSANCLCLQVVCFQCQTIFALVQLAADEYHHVVGWWGRLLKSVVVVDDSLEHCRKIDLNGTLSWSTITHATHHSPYDTAEDSIALAVPHDLTCVASVTHHSKLWLLLFVDWLVVMWIVTLV